MEGTMKHDPQSLEKQLPSILKKFNAVLKKHGIEGQVTRFMLGDPSDPAEKEKQKKIDVALSAAFSKPKSLSDANLSGCFVCCNTIECYWCCIA
jgi:hypothetical protein